MPEQRCENSQTNPCPRTDTRLFTTMIEGTCIYSIWLCPEHARPEWLSDPEVRRADTPPPGAEAVE